MTSCAALPGCLDHRHDFRRFAPDADRPELDVRDLDGKPRLLADRDRFAHGVERAVGFVADVRDVEAAVLRGDARERHDLGGRRVAADLVLEA